MQTEPATQRRRTRTWRGLGPALVLTAVSAVLPGTAHLSRRRWATGVTLLLAFALVVAAITLAATRPRQQLLALALRPGWLLGLALAAVLVALSWVLVVIWSYRVVRPRRLPFGGQVVALVTVSALCLLVCSPLLATAYYARAQRDLITDLFPDSVPGDSRASDPAPWEQRERLNILLIGADADKERYGLRTDTMIVASIDTDTGRTVLFSLPRNLENAPMPFPSLRQRFPNGFPKYLYALWQYGVNHPRMVPGNHEPGPRLLTATIEKILGIRIPYYALANLDGFKAIIDGLGGVWMRVKKPIRYGEYGQFVIRPGYQQLNGRQALWYARSRLYSSDYARMRRQRCLLGAIARQTEPMTVLRNYRQLADATKRTVTTNIPHQLLPELVGLASKVKDSTITNVQFVPPLVKTWNPDYSHIHAVTRRALGETQPEPHTAAPGTAPTPGRSPTEPTPPTSPSNGTSPASETAPTAGTDGQASGKPRPSGNPVSLEAACTY